MHQPSDHLKRRGFTLIELLVVIGIISLLISILMPVVSKARIASNDAGCLANLHQLAAAFQVYANNYDAWPPPANNATSQWWSQDYIYPIVYGKFPTAASEVNDTWVQHSIFQCPAAKVLNLPSGDTYLWESYGMSARLNNHYNDTGDYRNNFKYPLKVQTPTQTTLLIDCTQPGRAPS